MTDESLEDFTIVRAVDADTVQYWFVPVGEPLDRDIQVYLQTKDIGNYLTNVSQNL